MNVDREDPREAVSAALCKAMGGDDPHLDGWVDAVLAVPAIADALARDLAVRKLLGNRRVNRRYDADALFVHMVSTLFDGGNP